MNKKYQAKTKLKPLQQQRKATEIPKNLIQGTFTYMHIYILHIQYQPQQQQQQKENYRKKGNTYTKFNQNIQA